MTMYQNPVSVFLSYVHEDELVLRNLEKHLSLLQRQGLISAWDARQIVPGTNRAETIDQRLEQALIILLLVSADFLASDYCYEVEMKRALERHKAGQARVIPIVIRPVDWKDAPFAHLQPLPTDAKAVTTWSNQDEALVNVVVGIRQVIEELTWPSKQKRYATQSQVWNVPYKRNPFFVAREILLTSLYEQLHNKKIIELGQAQAISGLGGIGKTQVAVEYAYRHRADYQSVLWVNASNLETLQAEFVQLAKVLNLPEKDEQDQSVTVIAVKQWLTQHQEWLLILDNADDVVMVRDFLEDTDISQGHLVLTTRAQAVGVVAHRIALDSMLPDEGSLLLLRRARVLKLDAPLEQVSETDKGLAIDIVTELGGLPLALDQAGAYIEETNCGLARYLQSFQTKRKELLRRKGRLSPLYPESVATTWILAFQKVEQIDPLTVDLLRVCALLAPDTIPEEIIREGAKQLGETFKVVATDALKLDEMIEIVQRYSLLKRNQEADTLSIHRLVQAVLLDRMSQKEQKKWVKRVVRAVNTTFPNDVGKVKSWSRCQRLLPQVQACMTLIEDYNCEILEAAQLLSRTGRYLTEHAQYEQAKLLCQYALDICERTLGLQHLDTADALDTLAYLHHTWGNYEEAESLYLRAIDICKQILGEKDPETIAKIYNLAWLYTDQKRYKEAESLNQDILTIYEQVLGPDHVNTAATLNGLAWIYSEQGKLTEAEPLYQHALIICEKEKGPMHPDLAMNLNNLGDLYCKQKRYKEAEPLLNRALRIREQVLGIEHPETASSLDSLGVMYQGMGHEKQAEAFYWRALDIEKATLGLTHPYTQITRSHYADLLWQQGRKAEAIALKPREE